MPSQSRAVSLFGGEVPQTGKIKTFGPVGPPYEVSRPLRQLRDGDWLMQVTLVETGEVAEYRWSRIVGDPDAV